MKEKVLWLDLPEGSEYQKVIVAEKGRIGIVYLEECTCQNKKETTIAKVEIPKPKALEGGSEVYQNDDVPYWYCKIKNRDIFMHIYMEDLTVDDLLYDSKTGKRRKFSTRKQKKFEMEVLEALQDKPKEGFRWIPVYEPSLAPDGSLQFVKNEKPLVGLSCLEWDRMQKEYSPENESGKSSITTYFLLLLRWLKDGVATLEQLADHSEEIGHYKNSENAKYDFERTGERKFGGLYGFVGNTSKILEDSISDSGFSDVGGSWDDCGDEYSLNKVMRIDKYNHYGKYLYACGLLELRK